MRNAREIEDKFGTRSYNETNFVESTNELSMDDFFLSPLWRLWRPVTYAWAGFTELASTTPWRRTLPMHTRICSKCEFNRISSVYLNEIKINRLGLRSVVSTRPIFCSPFLSPRFKVAAKENITKQGRNQSMARWIVFRERDAHSVLWFGWSLYKK